MSKISETVAADFGYVGYYVHARSGLNLSRTRAIAVLLGDGLVAIRLRKAEELISMPT